MDEPIRLSVSEASRIFGVTEKTIRRGLASGALRYIVVRGRYKITFDSLLAWSQQRSGLRHKLQRSGIGKYVESWKIRNTLYSPNPERYKKTPPQPSPQRDDHRGV